LVFVLHFIQGDQSTVADDSRVALVVDGVHCVSSLEARLDEGVVKQVRECLLSLQVSVLDLVGFTHFK